MRDLIERTRAALAADGPLADKLEGYAPREAQRHLAEAVAEAMDDRATLIAEAGTGTGKTYAYLVPALLSGQRVIVSTGTRALQDQLYHRDLPRVRAALGAPAKTALLKGRANYLCRYRMEQAKGERFVSREVAAQFQRVLAWSGRTQRGDLAELPDIPEDSLLWPQVTSTTDNCLGSECPFWSECFVVKARSEAQAADVVVVNHHLLLADLAIKQEGFGEILPGASAFVLDEAHQLPELATQFFGEGVGARQLLDLARDALKECAGTPSALATVQQPVRQLEHAVRELRLAMNDFAQRGSASRVFAHAAAAAALAELETALDDLQRALTPLFLLLTCAGTSSRSVASPCSARRSMFPNRCADIASNRARPGSSLRRRWRWAGRSTISPRASVWKNRASCCNPAPSTGNGRRCASCRAACRNRTHAASARH